MPLILPEFYPYKDEISSSGILINEKSAGKGIRIGILNLMPNAETYESSVLARLGASDSDVEPVFIRSEVHTYGSSNKEHLDAFYLSFDDALKAGIVGLIITGAPVEKIDFSEVTYWTELYDIMQYSFDHLGGTMGLCWGGMAVAKFLGVGKVVFEKKIFGVFESKDLLTGRHFYCPHSRYAGFDEDDIRKKYSEGEIIPVGASPETGHFIISSAKKKSFIAHTGHPEYTVERILFEYHRDQKLGLNLVPAHFDVENPVYSWKGDGEAFFTDWLKF